MPIDQEKTEQIERYLSGGMTETERGAFEATLQRDPALAEALALHRALNQSLGDRQRRQLLDALADVAEREEQKRPALIRAWLSPFRLAAAAAVLVLVAAVGVWFYLQPRNESPAVVEQPASRPLPPPDSPPAATLPADKPAASGRLALADRETFEPNPALDPLVGALVRGENAAISVKKPENDAVLPLLNGKINFVAEGNAVEMTALTLRIYNNREADFASGKPVYEIEIPVRGQAFALNKSLKIPPGRYYAVLSAPGEEEPMIVLRFYAGQR